MSNELGLVRLFVDLADTMVDNFDVVEFMLLLAESSVQQLDVDAAGLMLADQQGALRLLVCSPTEPMRTLATFELDSGEGPCLDSFRTGQQVANVDLQQAQQRWPHFTARAAELGFSVTHALPLRLRGAVIGAMSLASTHPGGLLSDHDVAVGQALADVATIGLLQQRAISERSLLAEQLQNALTGRVLIEQAKGVLAERMSSTPDAAFEVLRRTARSQRRSLRDLAAGVVRRRRLPPDGRDRPSSH